MDQTDHLKHPFAAENPIHLGDGAYATLTEFGDVILTANSHEQGLATDTVVLDPAALRTFNRWLLTWHERKDNGSD